MDSGASKVVRHQFVIVPKDMESDEIILSEDGGRMRETETGRPHGWAMVQRVDDTDPVRANAQALVELEQGATGLSLVFEGAPNAFGYGLPATPEALETVLRDVVLTRTHLRIDVHPASRAMADWMVSLLARKRADPAKLSLSFGIDPAAIFAGTGRLRMSIEALQASMPQSLSHVIAMGVPGILLEADGRVFHNAGATAAQELAIVLATAQSHMRLFEEARQALVYAAPHIGFALSVDDTAESAAKVAVLRDLWDKLQAARSIEPTRATVHAETSFRIMSTLDPQANVERSARAAANAIAAEVDSLSILPHTIAVGLPGAASRQVALVSHLDVAARANATAAPTEADLGELASAAWSEFRIIEAEGGVLQSLLHGRIQERILEARHERAERLRRDGPPAATQQTRAGGDVIATEKRSLAPDGAVFCRQLEWWRDEQALSP